MDVVLEISDTFLWDYLYATVYPLSKDKLFAALDSGPNATAAFAHPGYSFEPASQYFYVNPTEWAYMSEWPRDNPARQTISLILILWLFGIVLYLGCASLSYFFIFDHATLNHPKYLKNQIWLEMKTALWALPGMALLTAPFMLAEVQGYAKLYDTADQAPFPLYNYLQFPLFLIFTDFFIYWIHRGLHHPLVYKTLHKPHHKWIMPTPFSSHAFHPVDGWAQSLPYHIFPFIFPLQKFAYVALFVFINIWTVLIHDGEYVVNSPIINGAACHTMHHLYFNYNYGEFTTLWDRLGGSYRKPNEELFQRDTKLSQSEWSRQVKEMEKVVKEVEGSDDRSYDNEDKKTK